MTVGPTASQEGGPEQGPSHAGPRASDSSLQPPASRPRGIDVCWWSPPAWKHTEPCLSRTPHLRYPWQPCSAATYPIRTSGVGMLPERPIRTSGGGHVTQTPRQDLHHGVCYPHITVNSLTGFPGKLESLRADTIAARVRILRIC